jgi:hypothetical protein
MISISDELQTLRDLRAEGKLVPFVGAGLSRPLGLPSWGLYFLTTNENKAAEAAAFFAQSDLAVDRNIELCVLKHDVQEIVDPDLEEVVRQR